MGVNYYFIGFLMLAVASTEHRERDLVEINTDPTKQEPKNIIETIFRESIGSLTITVNNITCWGGEEESQEYQLPDSTNSQEPHDQPSDERKNSGQLRSANFLLSKEPANNKADNFRLSEESESNEEDNYFGAPNKVEINMRDYYIVPETRKNFETTKGKIRRSQSSEGSGSSEEDNLGPKEEESNEEDDFGPVHKRSRRDVDDTEQEEGSANEENDDQKIKSETGPPATESALQVETKTLQVNFTQQKEPEKTNGDDNRKEEGGDQSAPVTDTPLVKSSSQDGAEKSNGKEKEQKQTTVLVDAEASNSSTQKPETNKEQNPKDELPVKTESPLEQKQTGMVPAEALDAKNSTQSQDSDKGHNEISNSISPDVGTLDSSVNSSVNQVLAVSRNGDDTAIIKELAKDIADAAQVSPTRIPETLSPASPPLIHLSTGSETTTLSAIQGSEVSESSQDSEKTSKGSGQENKTNDASYGVQPINLAEVEASSAAPKESEPLNENQSGNVVLLKEPKSSLSTSVEGSESEKQLSKMAANANIKTIQTTEPETPNAGESSKNVSKAGKDTTILIVLFVAVLVIGAAAFTHNFIKKRKQKRSENSELVNGIRRSLQNLTTVNRKSSSPDIEQGTEMKPLMKTNNSPVIVQEYSDANKK